MTPPRRATLKTTAVKLAAASLRCAASRLLAIWFEGGVQLIDTATGETREGFLEHEKPLVEACFALGGQRLMTRDAAFGITIWDTATLKQMGDTIASDLYGMHRLNTSEGGRSC